MIDELLKASFSSPVISILSQVPYSHPQPTTRTQMGKLVVDKMWEQWLQTTSLLHVRCPGSYGGQECCLDMLCSPEIQHGDSGTYNGQRLGKLL
jgi:hypothetical protein